MHRRTFIAASLSAGLVLAPCGGAGQQAGKRYRIGWLDYSSAADNLGIFVQAFAKRGWIRDKTFSIEYRGGEGTLEHLQAVAQELARLPVDVIIAPGVLEAVTARGATNVVPIVMTGIDDPVARRLVASLARPGGNVTGLAKADGALSAKLLSLLRETLPRASAVAVLWDSNEPDARIILGQLQGGARALGVELNAFRIDRYTDVEPAFATIEKQRDDMLIVPASSLLVPRWIADLALAHRLALGSTSPDYVYEGALLAYTNDWNAVFDRVADYVDRILKGGAPAELPVELPEKFKLIVNARTARALGITIPPSILVRADAVIE
jgi:ABC-type uncharacterized transport system substrate-binding protein